jgi:hypothetical protein
VAKISFHCWPCTSTGRNGPDTAKRGFLAYYKMRVGKTLGIETGFVQGSSRSRRTLSGSASLNRMPTNSPENEGHQCVINEVRSL